MATDPATVTMNVSMPQPLKQYVDGKVSSGIYGSASEFIREAIREKFQREQDRQDARSALAGKLMDGLNSGKPIPITEDYFKRKKAVLSDRVARKNKGS